MAFQPFTPLPPTKNAPAPAGEFKPFTTGVQMSKNPGYVAPKPQPVKQAPKPTAQPQQNFIQQAENVGQTIGAGVGVLSQAIKGIFTPAGGKPQPVKQPPPPTVTITPEQKASIATIKSGQILPDFSPAQVQGVSAQPTIKKKNGQVAQQPNVIDTFLKNYQPLSPQEYVKQAQADAKTPFFNNTGNNPIQWLGKVIQDTQKRGLWEGAQDLTYPILENPLVEPLEEPLVGAARATNYQMGRPNPIINNLLGMANWEFQKPEGTQYPWQQSALGKATAALKNAFPATTQNLVQLAGDFLSLKQHPDALAIDTAKSFLQPVTPQNVGKVINDLWTMMKPSFTAEQKNINAFFTAKTPTEKIGAGGEVIAGGINALSSPITSLFNAANTVPILGTVSRILTLAPAILGDAGADYGNSKVDQMHLPPQVASKVKEGVSAMYSLAFQIVGGEVGGIRITPKELTDKFGQQDAQTIITQAARMARSANQDMVQRVVNGHGTPEEIKQYETLARAGALRQFTQTGHAGFLPGETGMMEFTPNQAKGVVVGTDLENTPAGNAIIKESLNAQQTNQNVEVTIAKTGAGNLQTPGGLHIVNVASIVPSKAATNAATGKPLEEATPTQTTPLTPTGGSPKVLTLPTPQNYPGIREATASITPDKVGTISVSMAQEHTGSPIEQQAIKQLEGQLQEKGVKTVHVMVPTEQVPAWQKLGYEPIQDATLTDGKISMEKALSLANPEHIASYTSQLQEAAKEPGTVAESGKLLAIAKKLTDPKTTVDPEASAIMQQFVRTPSNHMLNFFEALNEKYGGEFRTIYDNIKSGKITIAEYEQAQKYYTESKNATKAGEGTGVSVPAKGSENGIQATENNPQSTGSQTGESKLTESPEGQLKDNAAGRGGTSEQQLSEGKPESLDTGTGNGIDTNAKGTGAAPKTNTGLEEPLGQPRSSVTLHAEVIPGLSKFFEHDVLPTLNAINEAQHQVSDVLNPPRASKEANTASNIVREALAKIENYSSIVHGKNESGIKFFSKFSDAQNIANISNYERTGQFLREPATKPGQPTYSQIYHDSLVDSYRMIQEAYGRDTEGFIENYVRRAFVFDSPAEEQKGINALTNFARSMSGSKSPLKQRVLDMPLDEAFKDMQGRGIKVKMQTTNPEELRQWSLVNAKRLVVFKQTWNDLKQSGLIKFVRKGSSIPDGMVPLNDRAAEVFAPAEVRYGVPPATESASGYQTAISVGKYYADPTVARILNNVIARGLEGMKVFQGLRFLGNQMNSFQLGFSAFHLTGSALNAGFSDIALGLRDYIKFRPISGTVKAIRGLTPGVSFARDLYHGREFLQQLMNDDPVAKEYLENVLNPAGGRTIRDKQYMNNMTDNVKKMLANGNVIGATLRLPAALVETVAHPLLNYAIPRVKIGAFMDLAASKLERLPVNSTVDQRRTALAAAWNSIDNRFGQLVYDNLFWNKTGKDLAMLSTRSVGWNLGDVRELGAGMVIDPIKTMLGGKERVNNNFGERFSDRMLFSLALILGTATISAIYQYLHTGSGPQELKDYFFPKDGGVDTAGNPSRRSMPTYWKDVYAFSNNPLATIGNKMSPGLATLLQLWENKDYYGNLIRNPNDLAGTQLAQAGSYLLANILPFAIQGANQPGQSFEQKAEGFFGITKAPARIIQSPQQQAAQVAYQNQIGLPAPKTPEQVTAANLKTKAYAEIKANGAANSPSYKALIANGTLNTPLKQKLFIKNAGLTSLQRMGSHLSKDQRTKLGIKEPPPKKRGGGKKAVYNPGPAYRP